MISLALILNEHSRKVGKQEIPEWLFTIPADPVEGEYRAKRVGDDVRWIIWSHGRWVE